MAPFKIQTDVQRHDSTSTPGAPGRTRHALAHQPPDDARAGALFRGLVYGVPIGLTMWLLLVLLLWRLA